jgi:hypothetical protein
MIELSSLGVVVLIKRDTILSIYSIGQLNNGWKFNLNKISQHLGREPITVLNYFIRTSLYSGEKGLPIWMIFGFSILKPWHGNRFL